jgi:hypothetical protein
MKKERSLIFSLLLVGFIILHTVCHASGDWKELVKKENGLVKEQRQEVEISVDDEGNLVIVSHVYEETMHFSDNANIYSEQSIGFSETFTEVNDLEAYSYIPTDKGKFKKIEVKDFIVSDSRSDGIFYDDQKKISFVYPALKAGSKTVLSYSKKYKEPRLWGYYLFSSFFPVEKSVYTVSAPENVALNYVIYGIDTAKVHFTKEKKGNKIFYSWKSDELNKILLSKGSDGLLNSAPHLIIYVDSYEYNGEKHQVLGGVSDLHSWYQKFLNGIDDDTPGNLEGMVNNIVAGKSTELEKVEAIYYWVQQNIKYIAIEDGLGGFRPRSANTVFTRRYGDCKDMSNLLHNMLNIANIPSNLAWIGTKSIPYSHREVPTPMADNHMICTYINGDKYYFLDATDQYNILGMPTSHIQGREALVHKGTCDFELVDVPVVPSEQNQVIDSIYVSIDQKQLLGKGKVTYSGYKRIPVTNNIENLTENDKKTFLNAILKKGNNKFSLNSVQTRFVAEKDRNLEIDYAFNLDDYIFNMSDEIFVNPHLDKEMEDGLIDVGATKKDIYYPYKSISSNVFSIEVPENYAISHLPEDRSYECNDFGFSINYAIDDNHVIMNQNIKINTIKLKTAQFDSWNKMVKGLFAAYKESIVFKKL